MAGESDRTRWVGTRKVHPAVADIDAISSFFRNMVSVVAVGGTNVMSLITVPANKVLMVQVCGGVCDTANPAFFQARVLYDATDIFYFNSAHTAAWQIHLVTTPMVVDEGESLRAVFTSCTAGDNITGLGMGYLIDKY